ncbi:MAG: DUF3786 domain-containing protein [Dehalococcoidales bacterium]|nr:DUF3786 domain-containing protein [Dehalococcoidales bacterium]
MEHLDKSIKFPDNRNYEYAYNQSFQLAKERLNGITDLTAQCQKSGANYDVLLKTITVDYLNAKYIVALPDVGISVSGGNETVPIRDKILILHYILTAKGTPLSNQQITFKELPEGIVYFRTFYQRTIKHIVANFSRQPDKLIEVGEKLGGHKADFGDAAVTINVLPRIPVTFIVWRGDEEFGAEGNVLYNSTITDYLPVEDIIVLSEVVTWKLVRPVHG